MCADLDNSEFLSNLLSGFEGYIIQLVNSLIFFIEGGGAF